MKRRPNEFPANPETWPHDAANDSSPRTLIISCGSRWGGEEPATVDELLAALATEALDPRFEEFGGFIDLCPIAANSERQLLPDGWVQFHGNFQTVSHVFQIVTNDPAMIAELTAAIRANQASERYAVAKENRLQAKARDERESAARHARYLKRMQLTSTANKKWKATFTGRPVNAKGIFSRFELSISAPTIEQARLKIYDTHEHLSEVSITKA